MRNTIYIKNEIKSKNFNTKLENNFSQTKSYNQNSKRIQTKNTSIFTTIKIKHKIKNKNTVNDWRSQTAPPIVGLNLI